jgi:hypothetical protein
MPHVNHFSPAGTREPISALNALYGNHQAEPDEKNIKEQRAYAKN